MAGYSECTGEVLRYLSSIEGVDADVKSRLINHLANGRQEDSTETGTGNMHSVMPYQTPFSEELTPMSGSFRRPDVCTVDENVLTENSEFANSFNRQSIHGHRTIVSRSSSETEPANMVQHTDRNSVSPQSTDNENSHKVYTVMPGLLPTGQLTAVLVESRRNSSTEPKPNDSDNESVIKDYSRVKDYRQSDINRNYQNQDKNDRHNVEINHAQRNVLFHHQGQGHIRGEGHNIVHPLAVKPEPVWRPW